MQPNKITSASAWSPETKLTTEEFAAAVRVKAETIRAGLCRRGHYLGIKPIKLGNRLLRWPASDVQRLLGSGPRAT